MYIFSLCEYSEVLVNNKNLDLKKIYYRAKRKKEEEKSRAMKIMKGKGKKKKKKSVDI